MSDPIKPQYRSKSATQALSHVVEEMGEAIAAAGKTLRWGPQSVNPELPPEQQERNIDWLARELDDVQRAINAFWKCAAIEGWCGDNRPPAAPGCEAERTKVSSKASGHDRVEP